MATKIDSRTYAIKDAETGKLVALVDAYNKVQALGHIAQRAYLVEPATRQEMYDAGKAGLEIESACKTAPQLDLTEPTAE